MKSWLNMSVFNVAKGLFSKRIFIGVGLVVLIIQLILFFNSQSAYGSGSALAEKVLLSYFILHIFALILISLSPNKSNLNPFSLNIQTLTNFSVGFIITSAILLGFAGVLSFLSGMQIFSVKGVIVTSLGYGLLHGFVAVYNEEIFFRLALPSTIGLGKPNMLSDAISSVLFGLFHWQVIGASIGIAVGLMILGFVWAMVRNYLGITGAMGSHLAWNYNAYGILGKIFGVVNK